MKTVAFFTLGCKVNSYDSSFMQALFLNSGYTAVDFGDSADIVVINTCTVTGVADKKSRAMIRRAAKLGKVIVAGCMAQKQADRLLEMDGVDAVIGTDERSAIVSIADKLLEGESNVNATHALENCEYEAMQLHTTGAHTRAVIKIQEGCNNFCSYCIIPYVRGRSRSRCLSDIYEEATALAQNGAKEFVLTGIHLASYEHDNNSLADVISKLDEIPNIRIRLGSIEPGVLGKEFISQVSGAKSLCPHFHLSLQSGSETVLERMNRKYTPRQYLDFAALLRDHFDNPAITTDIITGFPAETQKEHEQTLEFVEKARFARIHVFPFSSREGTKAYDMTPRVPKKIAKERAKALIKLGDICERNYLGSMIGRQEEVLFEETSNVFKGCMEGYSRRYFRVAANADKNDLKTVTLGRICDKIFLGN